MNLMYLLPNDGNENTVVPGMDFTVPVAGEFTITRPENDYYEYPAGVYEKPA
jgi:hypothetical protein